MSGTALEKRVYYGLLCAFYGPLLTELQQQTVQLYCNEDLSLAEVARQQNVSRQSVSDALRRSFEHLEALEARMGLMKRFQQQRELMAGCSRQMQAVLSGRQDISTLRGCVEQLEDYLQEEDADGL